MKVRSFQLARSFQVLCNVCRVWVFSTICPLIVLMSTCPLAEVAQVSIVAHCGQTIFPSTCINSIAAPSAEHPAHVHSGGPTDEQLLVEAAVSGM